MNKQQLIQEYLESPVKIGDFVKVRGLGRQDKLNWGSSTYVIGLHEDGIYIEEYNTKEGRFTKKLQEKLKQLQDE